MATQRLFYLKVGTFSVPLPLSSSRIIERCLKGTCCSPASDCYILKIGLAVFLFNFTVGPFINQSFAISTVNQDESPIINKPTNSEPPISDGLLGIMVGGIIGFISSIGVDRMKNWLDRPQLIILKQTDQSSFQYPLLSDSIMKISIPFTGAKIKVRNKGKTAAENCKATLVGNSSEFRIAWMLPREDMTGTINALDAEFIDICAIGKINNHWKLVFTTERGYGKSQEEGRNLEGWSQGGEIRAQLKVSCKNAKPCIENIIFLLSPRQDGQFVTLPDVQEDCCC
jgi:hypothetical protein